MLAECPDCATPLPARATSCRSCGWASSGKAAALPDLQRFRCAWQAHGDRCRNFGTISGDTKGAGPWYCREHYGCSTHAEGVAALDRAQAAVPDSQRYDADALVAAAHEGYRRRSERVIAPTATVAVGGRVGAEIHRLAESMRDPHRKRDPRDWARAILRDEAAGVYPGGAIGVRYAREALGIPAAGA